MTSRLPLTLFFVIVFMLIGGVIFIYKIMSGFPLVPEDKVNSWHLELSLRLENAPRNTDIRVSLPSDNEDLRIIDSTITDDGFGDYVGTDNDGSFIQWTKRKPNPVENLYYQAIVYKVKSADTTESEYFQPNILERSRLLQDNASVQALKNIRNFIQSESASNLSFITGLQKMMRLDNNPDLQFIRSRMPKADDVTIATEILNFADIPARSMNGILLSYARRDAETIRWVDAYTEKNKISFSPAREKLGMPSNILPWWSGDDRNLIFTKNVGMSISKETSVRRHTESALTEALWTSNKTKSSLYNLTMYALPVELQVVMRVLLLIPLGALACVAIKQIIGIKTFGTFMPVLLAMAFRETSLLAGIILFSILIGIGLIFRASFDKMRLLTVPRLGAILSVTVLSVFLLAIVLHALGFEAKGLSLFPLVILTMMIERISVTWDESGPQETIMITLSTLFVSALCYLVIALPQIEHIFTTFPELLLVVTALMLLIGRYNGYKLTEYYRFKALRS